MSEQIEEIEDLLAQYVEFQHAVTIHEHDLQKARKDVIPDEVQLKLIEIEIEFGGKVSIAAQKIAEVKSLIADKMRALPDAEYKTIKAAGFMIVAKDGKSTTQTTMNSETLVKGLETLAVNYPAIAPEISNILQMAKTTTTTSTERSPALQVDKK